MRMLHSKPVDVRIEVVTSTFVAGGRPVGVHDLGRLLETLNNGALSEHLELADATLRPLYRAEAPLALDAPILVRRDEIIFANFEGPLFTRGASRGGRIDAPALLIAPPFQIQGSVSCASAADRTQALRQTTGAFFLVRHARVFDADGNALGEGEQIIVNGGAVQMSSATRQHMAAASEQVERRARLTPVAAGEPAEEKATRAA